MKVITTREECWQAREKLGVGGGYSGNTNNGYSGSWSHLPTGCSNWNGNVHFNTYGHLRSCDYSSSEYCICSSGTGLNTKWELDRTKHTKPDGYKDPFTTVTILDDGDAGTIGIKQTSQQVEVQETAGKVYVTLERTGSQSGIIEIQWSTVDETAIGKALTWNNTHKEYKTWFSTNCIDMSTGIDAGTTLTVQLDSGADSNQLYTCAGTPPGDYHVKTTQTVRFEDGQQEAVVDVDLINAVTYENILNNVPRTFRIDIDSANGGARKVKSITASATQNWVNDEVPLSPSLSATVTVVDHSDISYADQIPPSTPDAPVAMEKTGGSIIIRPSLPKNVGGAHTDVLGHVLYMAKGTFPLVQTDSTIPYDYQDTVTPAHVDCTQASSTDASPCLVKTSKLPINQCGSGSDTHNCWRYVRLICMPQFFGPGCESTCPGYQKYSTQNSVHVCSGHGTCSSGLCDEDEITCTGAGTCDCDVGYEGADCSEGDQGIERHLISLDPDDSTADDNVPSYLIDRFDDPSIDDIESRRTYRLEASRTQGSNSDAVVAQRYYFYTVARTRITGGALLPSDQTSIVSTSPPSFVLNVATKSASLSRAPEWQAGTLTTGGRIDIKWRRPMDSGGVEPTGYRLQITNVDDSSDAPVVLQGETEKCVEETNSITNIVETICTGIAGLTEDPITKTVTYTRGSLSVDTGYEYVVQLLNDVGPGDSSIPLSVRTQQFATPPGAIQSPRTIGKTGGTITLTFSPPMDSGGVDITSYEIEIGTNNKDDNECVLDLTTSASTLPIICFIPYDPPQIHILEVSGGDTSLTVRGLVSSTTYWARARADNGDSVSGRRPGVWRKNELVGLFPISTGIMTSPTAPQVPTSSSVTGGMIKIQWTPPLDFGGADRIVPFGIPDLTGYRIFMRKTGQAQFETILETDNENILEYQIGFLEKETEYEFRVRAMNEVAACDDTEDPNAILPNDNPIYVSDSLFVKTTAQTPPGSLQCSNSDIGGVDSIERCKQVFGKDITSGLTTGGMVTIEVTAPKDTGGASLSNIRYKVEVVKKNGPTGIAEAPSGASLGSSRILSASACNIRALKTNQITLNENGDWQDNGLFVACVAEQTCASNHASDKTACNNDIACTWSMPLSKCMNRWELSESIALRPEERNNVWRIQLYRLDHSTTYDFRVVAYDISVPSLGDGAPSDAFTATTIAATAPKAPSNMKVVDIQTCQDKGWAIRSGSNTCSSSLKNSGGGKICPKNRNYNQAERICFDHNLVVCSLSEIAADQTTDASCGNDQRVWSSTPCSDGATCSTIGCVYTLAGKSSSTQTHPTECTSTVGDVDIHVRCCTRDGDDVRTIAGGLSTFKWTEPLDTGGKPITKYVVSQSECTRTKDAFKTRTCQEFVDASTVSTTSATSQIVSHLLAETEYLFRTRAVTDPALGSGPNSVSVAPWDVATAPGYAVVTTVASIPTPPPTPTVTDIRGDGLEFAVYSSDANNGGASISHVQIQRRVSVDRTCTQLNWISVEKLGILGCGSSSNKLGRTECSGDRTYQGAVNYCAASGTHVCTADELNRDQATDGGASGSTGGCGYNTQKLWTSTACDSPICTVPGSCFYTAAGSSAGASSVGSPECTYSASSAVKYKVRCCALEGKTERREFDAPVKSVVETIEIDVSSSTGTINADLPNGWTKVYDSAVKKDFYYHASSDSTSWYRPVTSIRSSNLAIDTDHYIRVRTKNIAGLWSRWNKDIKITTTCISDDASVCASFDNRALEPASLVYSEPDLSTGRITVLFEQPKESGGLAVKHYLVELSETLSQNRNDLTAVHDVYWPTTTYTGYSSTGKVLSHAVDAQGICISQDTNMLARRDTSNTDSTMTTEEKEMYSWSRRDIIATSSTYPGPHIGCGGVGGSHVHNPGCAFDSSTATGAVNQHTYWSSKGDSNIAWIGVNLQQFKALCSYSLATSPGQETALDNIRVELYGVPDNIDVGTSTESTTDWVLLHSKSNIGVFGGSASTETFVVDTTGSYRHYRVRLVAPVTCTVKNGGTNANCASAVADLATCNAASIQNTCTVKNGGNNADCAAAFENGPTCTAATTSGGSGLVANDCVFIDNSMHICEFVNTRTFSIGTLKMQEATASYEMEGVVQGNVDLTVATKYDVRVRSLSLTSTNSFLNGGWSSLATMTTQTTPSMADAPVWFGQKSVRAASYTVQWDRPRFIGGATNVDHYILTCLNQDNVEKCCGTLKIKETEKNIDQLRAGDGLQADVLTCTVTSYGEPNASPVQGYTSEPRIFYTASNTIAGNMTFDDPTVTVSENVQYVEIPILRETGTDGVCKVSVQIDSTNKNGIVLDYLNRAEYGDNLDVLKAVKVKSWSLDAEGNEVLTTNTQEFGEQISVNDVLYDNLEDDALVLDFLDDEVRKVIVLEINNDAHAQAKNGQGSGKEFPQEEFRLKLVQYEDPATNALSTCVIGRETQYTVIIEDDGDAGYIEKFKITGTTTEYPTEADKDNEFVAITTVEPNSGSSQEFSLTFLRSGVDANFEGSSAICAEIEFAGWSYDHSAFLSNDLETAWDGDISEGWCSIALFTSMQGSTDITARQENCISNGGIWHDSTYCNDLNDDNLYPFAPYNQGTQYKTTDKCIYNRYDCRLNCACKDCGDKEKGDFFINSEYKGPGFTGDKFVKFENGEKEETVTFKIYRDTRYEGSEKFMFRLKKSENVECKLKGAQIHFNKWIVVDITDENDRETSSPERVPRMYAEPYDPLTSGGMLRLKWHAPKDIIPDRYILERCEGDSGNPSGDKNSYEQCTPVDPLDSSRVLDITGAFHCASVAHQNTCKEIGGNKWKEIADTSQLNHDFFYTWKNGLGNSVQKTALSDRTHYIFRVKAVKDGLSDTQKCNNYSPVLRISTSAPTPPGKPDWDASQDYDIQGGLITMRWKEPINRGGGAITGYRVYLRRFKENTNMHSLVTEDYKHMQTMMVGVGAESKETDVIADDCDDDRCGDVVGADPPQCRCLVFDTTTEPNAPVVPPKHFQLSCYRRATEAVDTLLANTNGPGDSQQSTGQCAIDEVEVGSSVKRKDLKKTNKGRWAFPCIKTLRQLKEYTFEVQAKNDVSFGSFSVPQSYTTTGTSTPGRPKIPTVLARTGGSILLKMHAPENQGGADFTNLRYTVQVASKKPGQNSIGEWEDFKTVSKHNAEGYPPEWAKDNTKQRIVALSTGDALTEKTQYRFRVSAKSKGDVSFKIDRIEVTDGVATVYHEEQTTIKIFKGSKIQIVGLNWNILRQHLTDNKFGSCAADNTVSCNINSECDGPTNNCNLWGMKDTQFKSFGFEKIAQDKGVQFGTVIVAGDTYVFPAPTKSSFSIFAPDYRRQINGQYGNPVRLPNGVYKFQSTYDGSPARAKTADSSNSEWSCGTFDNTAYRTVAMTMPEETVGAQKPYMMDTTGGQITIKMVAPLDQGGGVIKGFMIQIAPENKCVATCKKGKDLKDATSKAACESIDQAEWTEGIDNCLWTTHTPVILQQTKLDPIPPVNVGRYANKHLIFGTKYYFRSVALNDISACLAVAGGDTISGDSDEFAWGQPNSATTKAVATKPSPPQQIKVIQKTGGSLFISWIAPLDTGGVDIDGYRISRASVGQGWQILRTMCEATDPVTGEKSGGEYVGDGPNNNNDQCPRISQYKFKGPGDIVAGTNIMLRHETGKYTNYFDKGLDSETEYTYKVRSLNSVSKYDPSSIHSISTEYPFKTDVATTPRSDEYPRCKPWLMKVTGDTLEIAFLPPKDTGGVPVEELTYSVQMASARDPFSDSLKNEKLSRADTEGNAAAGSTDSGDVSTNDAFETLKIKNDEMNVKAKEWQFKQVYNGKATGFIHFHLTPNTVYAFKVAAINSIGGGPYSSVFVTETWPTVTKPLAIQRPTVLKRTGGSIDLQFMAPLSTGGLDIKAYDVYWEELKDDGITWSKYTFLRNCRLPYPANNEIVHSMEIHPLNQVDSESGSMEFSESAIQDEYFNKKDEERKRNIDVSKCAARDFIGCPKSELIYTKIMTDEIDTWDESYCVVERNIGGGKGGIDGWNVKDFYRTSKLAWNKAKEGSSKQRLVLKVKGGWVDPYPIWAKDNVPQSILAIPNWDELDSTSLGGVPSGTIQFYNTSNGGLSHAARKCQQVVDSEGWKNDHRDFFIRDTGMSTSLSEIQGYRSSLRWTKAEPKPVVEYIVSLLRITTVVEKLL